MFFTSAATGLDSAHPAASTSPFGRAYVRMTQLYGYTRDIPGYYQDVQYFNHVDAVFEKYYTDSYYSWANGRQPRFRSPG